MLADLAELYQLLPELARYLRAYVATCLDDWRDVTASMRSVAAYLQEMIK